MTETKKVTDSETSPDERISLESGTYEIIRKRLLARGAELQDRIALLDEERKRVFGSIEPTLIGNERIPTVNNCIPRDMVTVGDKVLFGYNVRIGLRSETKLTDVFAVYRYGDRSFSSHSMELIKDERFESDFCDLYRYYKDTRFAKFLLIGPFLYMVFHVSENSGDIKCFKWSLGDSGTLNYIDNRSDHEVKFPPQHEFEWQKARRDMHRTGSHPHISVNDAVFVETIGGDLTVKIEDNTETGEGIYSEPVENPDQTLDDADIGYSDLGSMILMKIRPYQEKKYRYLVFSRKIRTVCRIDRIEDSCVLLPEEHGIIFANGYYLRTGEYREFESDLQDMRFEKRIASSNGEDFLYVFYNRDSGTYVLLSYNMIRQEVDNPIVCHGYSLFGNGELVYFKADEEPRKSHVIRIWQTPFLDDGVSGVVDSDSYLYRIGNSDIVRCMAGCRNLLGLIRRDKPYDSIYTDMVSFSKEIVDGFFWLDREEAFDLKTPLSAIRDAADSAIDEFDKVRSLKQHSEEAFKEAEVLAGKTVSSVSSGSYNSIEPFIKGLAGLRQVRGQIIALKDLRYMDLSEVEELESDIIGETGRLAGKCVDFLTKSEALDPYRVKIEEITAGIDQLKKVSDAKLLDERVTEVGSELEMLLDIVGNLKVDDATQRTMITDGISSVFSSLNRIRSSLKNRISDMASVEGKAEFGSQIQLLNQTVINYLDVCDTAEKCEEYLGKVMIQLEELEGKFANFDDFVSELSEKREDIYNTFESRRLKLAEEQNRKADSLMRSAERILKGVRNRAEKFGTIQEIHSYFAGDLMIEKVRGIIVQLSEMDDTVRAGDIQVRLKTIREDVVRQLKDRNDLYVDGENVIQLGRHRFAVNTQELDLTVIRRERDMFLHLTGTNFFEKIREREFLETEKAWEQDIVSESDEIYRSEYLAYLLFNYLTGCENGGILEEYLKDGTEQRIEFVRNFMGPRYSEGYVKGIHDMDAEKILTSVLHQWRSMGLIRFSSCSRALAMYFWNRFDEQPRRTMLEAKLRSFGKVREIFGGSSRQQGYTEELMELINGFSEACPYFSEAYEAEAAEFLFHVLSGGMDFPVSSEAAAICCAFRKKLDLRASIKSAFDEAIDAVSAHSATSLQLHHDWIEAFVESRGQEFDRDYVMEASVLIYTDSFDSGLVVDVPVKQSLESMCGSHSLIEKGVYSLHYHRYMGRLSGFARTNVPLFESYLDLKTKLLRQERENMRLDEFKPRVLTSFVRNRLIDQVYLPLFGDNLAKQIGVVGNQTRTDRMGMLLLISPPGYGKTTLMEYLSSRLGLIFMKINGPAMGHQVTSLDPSEAPNATAREELNKLNLALEMGDNVMLYVDDIQHCNPEFLQKFISLCDGQRKIEGVYKGRTKTYDLRGRTFAVVMAGNPYTESGEKFRIPDMLSNRADTYNLGDIIGDNSSVFELSYIENALTSNPVLNPLTSRSQNDICNMIKIAETGSREGVEFEGKIGREELNDYISVIRKLFRIRDVVLKINQEYIRSAAQADEFRAEPPFKLQGSYRNMCRLSEKVQPVMNDSEVETLIAAHYENEAQTLTSGAEANLLKFRELTGVLNPEDRERWEDIRETFKRNLLLKEGGEDRFGQAIVQLSTMNRGLQIIGEAVGDISRSSEDSSEP